MGALRPLPGPHRPRDAAAELIRALDGELLRHEALRAALSRPLRDAEIERLRMNAEQAHRRTAAAAAALSGEPLPDGIAERLRRVTRSAAGLAAPTPSTAGLVASEHAMADRLARGLARSAAPAQHPPMPRAA